MRYVLALLVLFVMGMYAGYAGDNDAKKEAPPVVQPADQGQGDGNVKNDNNPGQAKKRPGNHQPPPAEALPYTEYVQGDVAKEGQIRLWLEDSRTKQKYVVGLAKGQCIRVYNNDSSHVDFIDGQYKRIFNHVLEIEMGATAQSGVIGPGAPVGR